MVKLCSFCGVTPLPNNYRKYCDACQNEARKAWKRADYAANAEKYAAQKREIRKNNGDHVRAVYQSWCVNNRDRRNAAAARYREKPETKEYARAFNKKYREENPELVASEKAKWMAVHRIDSELREEAQAKMSELGYFSLENWNYVLSIFGNCCAYCKSNDSKLTRDHFVPISKGGLHVNGNIVPACKSCNSAKRNKLLQDWRPDLVQEITEKLSLCQQITNHL